MAKKLTKAEEAMLTADEINKFREIICTIWTQIASDAYAANAECGEGDITNEIAIEMCLDAGRPSFMIDKATGDWVDGMFKRIGYKHLDRILNAKIQAL